MAVVAKMMKHRTQRIIRFDSARNQLNTYRLVTKQSRVNQYTGRKAIENITGWSEDAHVS
jgi:hypothetical protein